MPVHCLALPYLTLPWPHLVTSFPLPSLTFFFDTVSSFHFLSASPILSITGIDFDLDAFDPLLPDAAIATLPRAPFEASRRPAAAAGLARRRRRRRELLRYRAVLPLGPSSRRKMVSSRLLGLVSTSIPQRYNRSATCTSSHVRAGSAPAMMHPSYLLLHNRLEEETDHPLSYILDDCPRLASRFMIALPALPCFVPYPYDVPSHSTQPAVPLHHPS